MAFLENLFNEDPDKVALPIEGQASKASKATTAPESTEDEEEISGLDKFTKMLYSSTNGKDSKEDSEPTAPIDPTKLFDSKESVNTIMDSLPDFTKNISPQTQKLLEANDPSAMAALINDATRAGVMETLKYSSHLTKETIADAVKRAVAETQGKITSSFSDMRLEEEMPELNNPLIRRGLEGLKADLKAQNPTMGPKELASQLKEMLASANAYVNPSSTAPGKGKKDTQDTESWADWLES